jgi:hypothetical protein
MLSTLLFSFLLYLDPLVVCVSLSQSNDNTFLKSDIAIASHFSNLAYSSAVPSTVSLNLNGSCATWKHVERIENQPTSTLVDLWSQGPTLMVAFRGTQFQTLNNLKSNLDKDLVPCSRIASSCTGRVHEGFLDAYMSVQQQLKSSIANQNFTSLYMTGHSLGASLATLATTDMAASKKATSLINFGSPKVGDAQFKDYFIASQTGSFHRIRTREMLQSPFKILSINYDYNAEAKDLIPSFPPSDSFQHIIPETFLDLDSQRVLPRPLSMHQIKIYCDASISMLPPSQQSTSCT